MLDSFKFSKRQKLYLVIKRCFDITFSLVAIIFCSFTIWIPIVIINIFATKGHPFFTPERLGKNNQVFKMFKFRTMKYGSLIKPPYELSKEEFAAMETRFGKFLRSTSLDETLQYLNVLSGKMSLIGPRPCAAKDEDILLNARNAQNPNPSIIRPGLTGLAQVNMKRKHDANTKAKFDSEYVKNLGFVLDLKIFFKTFMVVFHK